VAKFGAELGAKTGVTFLENKKNPLESGFWKFLYLEKFHLISQVSHVNSWLLKYRLDYCQYCFYVSYLLGSRDRVESIFCIKGIKGIK
jgi:hypothetical protein